MYPPDNRLDGNVVAGPLANLFVFEVTTIRCTCATCGAVALVAEHDVYVDAPGTIVRCRSCHAPVLRFVETPQRTWVDLRGAKVLEIPTVA
jgi:hypothetical protein